MRTPKKWLTDCSESEIHQNLAFSFFLVNFILVQLNSIGKESSAIGILISFAIIVARIIEVLDFE